MKEHKKKTSENGLPPFVNTWGQLYAIVLGETLVLILLFYWLSKAFTH